MLRPAAEHRAHGNRARRATASLALEGLFERLLRRFEGVEPGVERWRIGFGRVQEGVERRACCSPRVWLAGARLRPVRWRNINGPPAGDEPIRIQIDCRRDLISIAGSTGSAWAGAKAGLCGSVRCRGGRGCTQQVMRPGGSDWRGSVGRVRAHPPRNPSPALPLSGEGDRAQTATLHPPTERHVRPASFPLPSQRQKQRRGCVKGMKAQRRSRMASP